MPLSRPLSRSLPLLLSATLGCAGPRAVAPVEPTLRSAAQRGRDAAAAARVIPFLDAYENFGPVLAADGERFLFRSDRGGSAELFLGRIGHPGEPPVKLVAGPDRVASAIFADGGRSVLFRRDSGADENFHILRIASDGSGVAVDLTPKETLWRDSPLLPRDRPGMMIYSARKTTDYASMIVVQDLAGGEPRVVYRNKLPGTVVDVSADGTRALWIREAVVGGHELLEVTLDGGSERQIAPTDGKPAQVKSAAYAVDGKRVYLATDGGNERQVVVALDLPSLVQRAEYRQESPETAQVPAIVPSPRGDRVAILVDAGNHSMVRLLDATTLALVREVATPLGTVRLGQDTEVRYPLGAGTFSADGARFAIGLSSPANPSDLLLVDVASGAITPLRSDERPGLSHLPAIAATIEKVRAFDGLEIPVNLYLPTGAHGKLPTLVYLHGGPDASTALDWSPWTRVFLDFGFAVAEPNIRGSTGFGSAYERADNREKRDDAMRDLESVNRWARAQSWCDPERLIIQGGSYGGYLVLMGLTRQPALWAAGVDLAGPSDLPTFLGGDAMPTRYFAEFGDPKKEPALLARFSPLRDAGKIIAPLFVYQGQNDQRVPRRQADQMVREVRRRNVPVEYMVAGDEGHTVARRKNQVEFLTRMIRFLDDALKIR